jgi:hypothetical protein
MRLLVLLIALLALPAHADLYRWVDPQTGSVKFSSYPPPWVGDQQRERGAPVVEVIRHQTPAAAQAPRPAAAAPVKPAAPLLPFAELESQWQSLLQFFSSIPSNVDFDGAGAAFQQHAQMYQAVSAELDRQDPAGAARRRAQAQEAGILGRLRSGFDAQFSIQPPAQK